MKGAVFIALNDMVEEAYGIKVWEEVLAQAKPESEGVYASAGSYKDEEIIALLVAFADVTDIDINEITRSFGNYLFKGLNSKFPIFANMYDNFFDFLCSIEGVIHKEVEKLYPNASLPKIQCVRATERHIQMLYSSPRKMCFLAEGLISGAAEHFKVHATINQSKCCHRNDDFCVIDIELT